MTAIPANLLDTVVTGDARELARLLPDESVDLCFCDPVYDRIEDYRWLAEECGRVLKPDGAFLCFCGIGHLRDTLNVLPRIRWVCGIYKPYVNRRGQSQCFNWWACLLWVWGESRVHFVDMQMGARERLDVIHGWRKDADSIQKFTSAFTHPGAVVWDPFTGGGTVPAVCKQLGRRYVAFEIEPTTAERARQRIHDTPMPLFIPDAPPPPALCFDAEEVTA